MAFALPTLRDLFVRARTSFRANLKGSDAWVWPNNVYASAKVIGGEMFELFGFMSYVEKQKFAHTAPDLDSLILHGNEFGIARKSAAPAVGSVAVTSSASIEIDAGAIFRRIDDVEFVATSGGKLLTAGVLTIPVQAVADGKASNTEMGTGLVLASGFVTTGLVTAEASTDIRFGVDAEDIESYRARILFRKRNPPHGGSAADYVIWASEVSGVTRVFVERLWNGRGTVRVFVLMDELYPDGIPDSSDVIRVRQYVTGLMPAGVELTVAAPIARPIDVTISGLTPATTQVQDAVKAELVEMFRRRSRVAGNDTEHSGMPFLATPTEFSRSWVTQAIANATGEDRHVLVTPAGNVTLLRTEIATLGNVSFT